MDASSINALMRAIKGYEGSIVIVSQSHNFCTFCCFFVRVCRIQQPFPGLISQVANELWEVKNCKICNLTREDISIVDYKKMLVQKSTLVGSSVLAHKLMDKHRFYRVGEGQIIQQNCCQGGDINVRNNAFIRNENLHVQTLRFLYKIDDIVQT